MKRYAIRVVSALIILSFGSFVLAQDQKTAEQPQQQAPPANPGFLGGRFAPVEGEIAEQLELEEQDGVAVVEVMPNTPAEKSGLKVKDVLKKIDDKAIDGVDTFRQVMGKTKPGQTLKMLVIRDKEETTIPVTLGERPKNFNPGGPATQPTTKPG